MFLIPLILTAGLDLSLPEFQPEVDASGNVIVFSDDSVEVTPLEELPINDLLNDVSDTDVKSVFDNESPSRDNSLNDIVKDSGGISAGSGAKAAPSVPEGYHIVNMDATTLLNVYISASTPYKIVSNNSKSLKYFYLQAGVTYYLTTSATGVFYGSDTSVNTTLTLINGTTQSYTPDVNTYAFAGGEKTFTCYYFAPDDVSGDDISGSDMTAVVEGLAVINENISEINDKLDDLSSAGADDSEVLDRHTQLFRAMLLCLLITFLYPIALSIVRNIVGGDSNV